MRKRQHDTPLQVARAHGEEQQLHTSAARLCTTANATKPTQLDNDGIVAVAVPTALAAIVLGVYIKTLYPSVAGGDSGELVAESCHLGVSHPPGYPLFNMAVHAFALLLPWGAIASTTTIAWRANLFSASTCLLLLLSCDHTSDLHLRCVCMYVVLCAAVCDTTAAVLIHYCVLHWTPRQSGSLIRHVPAFTAAVRLVAAPAVARTSCSIRSYSLLRPRSITCSLSLGAVCVLAAHLDVRSRCRSLCAQQPLRRAARAHAPAVRTSRQEPAHSVRRCVRERSRTVQSAHDRAL